MWIGSEKRRTKAESVSSRGAKTVPARAHMKDRAKNKRLLSTLVERTDVINLYRTRVSATFVSRSLMMSVVSRWQTDVRTSAKPVKDDLIKVSAHLSTSVRYPTMIVLGREAICWGITRFGWQKNEAKEREIYRLKTRRRIELRQQDKVF